MKLTKYKVIETFELDDTLFKKDQIIHMTANGGELIFQKRNIYFDGCSFSIIEPMFEEMQEFIQEMKND